MTDRMGYLGAMILGCISFALLAEEGGSSAKSLYTDQGNGIILDRKNNLLWQRCNYGQTLKDRRCLNTALRLPRKEAVAFCATLKLGRTGKDARQRKWRLPTVEELGSLVRDARRRPSIDLELFPGTSPFQYWSHTTFLDDRGLWAYVYSFEHSYRFGVNKGVFYARCVSKF